MQSISVLSRVHTVPEEFEKGGFTLKTHQRVSVHTAPEEFQNLTITSYLHLCLKKTHTAKYNEYRNVTVSKNLRFQNVFRLR